MFFKRLTKTKPVPPAEPNTDASIATGAAPAEALDKEADAHTLSSHALRRSVDSKALGFKTTADLEPATDLLGQERARQAIDFGLGMTARDFNIFVAGPPAAGKSTFVRNYLAKVAAASQAPSDWVYVANFEDPRRPRALALPAGRGRALRRGLTEALGELAATLPAAFRSEDYLARHRAIDEDYRAGQEDALDDVHARAAQQNIAILRTPLGFAMAPMHDGKVVKPEVFNQLPEAMRRDVETRIALLQTELETILAHAPAADKERRRQLAALDAEVAHHAIEDALDGLSAAFADLPDVAAYLAEVESDLAAHCSAFVMPAGGDGVRAAPAEDVRLRRYLATVVVSHADDAAGAPVCELPYPTVRDLVGHVEAAPAAPGHAPDLLAIRPGALHRANGGALMIDAQRLIAEPAAWACLRQALRTGEIRIDGAPSDASASADASGARTAAAASLVPEPIPLAIKVVLVGEPELFADLALKDPDFASLFKVQAEFEESVARSTEADAAYTRLIAAMVDMHDLKPVSAGGVARLMEEAARLAEDRDKLTVELGRIADLLREADYWAGADGRKITTGDDVQRAIRERTRRADRARDHIHDSVTRGVVLVDTAGQRVGQLNALSLVETGSFSFGRPARVTARVHLGSGRVTDIEREVALGGPLHSKGVLILWGYLAGRFAQEVPLALAATLGFEQSYETVEGDSASAAELMALLSALAEAPLRQELAVTGSVNQWGDVQAVGGVNEKIEGFFDVCAARGLTGKQGVIIPEANRQHLMLREDVVSAVRDKRFAVYAIKTIDEGLALLTGLDAGERSADGRFGAATVNGRVEAKLRAYADLARGYASGPHATGAVAAAAGTGRP